MWILQSGLGRTYHLWFLFIVEDVNVSIRFSRLRLNIFLCSIQQKGEQENIRLRHGKREKGTVQGNNCFKKKQCAVHLDCGSNITVSYSLQPQF